MLARSRGGRVVSCAMPEEHQAHEARAHVPGDAQDRFYVRRAPFVDAHERLHEQIMIERLSPLATCYDDMAELALAALLGDDLLDASDVSELDGVLTWLEQRAALHRARATAAAHFASPS